MSNKEKLLKIEDHVNLVLKVINNNIGCEVGDEKIYIPEVKKVVENIKTEIVKIINE